jgi:Carboxypeptidase regulatory-like domain
MIHHVRRWSSSVAAIAVFAATWTLAAQTKPPQTNRDTPKRASTGTGLIAGTLVGQDSATPIRRAHVNLTSVGTDAGEVAFSVTTDDLGAFAFADLPPGTFRLAASKQGYLDTVYGQKRPGTGRPGTPVALADGQKIEHLTFTMARGGAISGTVVDDAGQPEMAAHVQVFRAVTRSGQRSLQPGDGTLTDDRGAYRIGVLSPGEYVVCVFPQNVPPDALSSQQLRQAAEVIVARAQAGSDEQAITTLKAALERARDLEIPDSDGYAPVYFPGTTQMSAATPILIEPGQERSGVDLQLQLVRTAFVSGIVTDGDAGSMQSATVTQVFLSDADQSMAGRPTYTARAAQDGKFSIAGVPPGHYTVQARSTRTVAAPDTPASRANSRMSSSWAAADVVVEGRNIADVSLVLQKGMTVSGVVKPDVSGAAFDLSRLRVTLASVASSGAIETATVADSGGAFSFAGLPPGRYRVSVSGQPAGWSPKSAIFGGRDALDQFLEVKPAEDASGVVTMTTQLPTLSGKLQDSSGQPTSAYTIIVFPGDERLWLPDSRRIRATRPATDGRYALTDLPAGDYRLVAVTDADPGQWFDPAFLRELAAVAMPIVLGDGERRIQDLKVK